jgi:hypothetical protein
MRPQSDWIRRALRRHARKQYVSEADGPFTSGNLSTQKMDVLRLPLSASARLDAGNDGGLFLIGLSLVGGEDVIGL